MDKETRTKLIDQYKDGYRVVAESLAGATDQELDTPPAPGKWTAREIAHHLGDSEMTAAVRLRLLLATPRPQIMGTTRMSSRGASITTNDPSKRRSTRSTPRADQPPRSSTA